MKSFKSVGSERSLFVCYTPLQSKIASRIIQDKHIKEYDVFYFTHTINEAQTSHFDSIAKNATWSHFWHCETRFPAYFSELRSIFSEKKYDSIYISSIDNIYCHLILTYADFSHLFTFDDGNANIIYNSLYYECEVPLYKRLVYRALGCNYTMDRIKRESEIHYSIYRGRKNIIDKVEFVSLISNEEFLNRNVPPGSECNVFLGSYFSYVVQGDIEHLCRMLRNYFEEKSNIFYIPHPMQRTDFFSNLKKISQPGLLAEDLILRLSKEYETVNVYGIASSAQFNLSSVLCIKNYTLVSDLLTTKCNEVSHSLIELGAESFHVD